MATNKLKFEDLTAKQQEFLTCKPSRLVEIAIEDLKALAKTKGFKIDMGTWVCTKYEKKGSISFHFEDLTPERAKESGYKPVCYVCLGGAALVGCGFNQPFYGGGVEVNDLFDGHEFTARRRVSALNDFRVGSVLYAVSKMNEALMPKTKPYPTEGLNNDIWVPNYQDGTKEFYQGMNEVIEMLKNAGI